MSNAKLDGRSTYGAVGAINDRRARRAERQILVSNIAVVGAFLFVSAVIFGFVAQNPFQEIDESRTGFGVFQGLGTGKLHSEIGQIQTQALEPERLFGKHRHAKVVKDRQDGG